MPTANLTVQVEPGSDALHRVVCVCRRRSLEILALTYIERQITLTVRGDAQHVRGIDRWLSALVDVFDVDRNDGGVVECVTQAR